MRALRTTLGHLGTRQQMVLVALGAPRDDVRGPTGRIGRVGINNAVASTIPWHDNAATHQANRVIAHATHVVIASHIEEAVRPNWIFWHADHLVIVNVECAWLRSRRAAGAASGGVGRLGCHLVAVGQIGGCMLFTWRLCIACTFCSGCSR